VVIIYPDWRLAMSTTKHLVTAEELFRMPDDGFRYELVRGELRQMIPAGGEHGIMIIVLCLYQHDIG
jgi:Uma2 family endonuclease